MASWVKPGAKCVCVDIKLKHKSKPGYEWVGDLDGLSKGQEYTIRDSFIDPHTGDFLVRLVEITRPVEADEGFEAGYYPSRFRPLVTRTQEQDMEHFLHMLKTKELTS